jgi:hypothetical protein
LEEFIDTYQFDTCLFDTITVDSYTFDSRTSFAGAERFVRHGDVRDYDDGGAGGRFCERDGG